MIARRILILGMLMCIPLSMTAQSSKIAGKIRGEVVDQQTGEPLIGANVLVKGTQSGATTNLDGKFVIPNVPAGTYDVEARYIGYAPMVLTGVTVYAGQSITLSFSLKTEALQGEQVEVVAEARQQVVSVRTPTSQREIKGEDLNKMPVNDFLDLLANTGGVSETEGGLSEGIHVRGGRDGEVAYYVDGIKTNDPVTANKGIELDNEAIEQVIISTSNYSAEYGEAMSGAVTIITKDGGKEEHGGLVEFDSDLFVRSNEMLDNGYDKYRFSLNGPVPFTKGALTYYMLGTYEDTDIRSPRFQKIDHNGQKARTGTGKIVYSPEQSAFKMIFSGSFDRTFNELYNHNYSKGNWLQDYYERNSGHNRMSLKIQDNLSKNFAWEFFVSRYETFTNFSPQDNASYKDFQFISKRLDWVNVAYDSLWYDDKMRSWEPLAQRIEDGRANSIVTSIYDQLQARQQSGEIGSNVDLYEQAAFLYYYANEGYLDSNLDWVDSSSEMEAMNERWSDTGHYYIPSELDPVADGYDPSDSTVHYQPFDAENYGRWLAWGSQEVADENGNALTSVHDLYSYQGDIHEGWRDYDYWFNRFRYAYVPRYSDRHTTINTAEMHINWQVNTYNELKIGSKYELSDLSYTDIQFLNTNPYFDSYEYDPESFAAWVENKLEFEDLIIQTGLRFDRFNPNARTLINADSLSVDEVPGVDTQPTDPKVKFSPRIGVSFAVSDRTSMYTNYGHFFQVAQFSELYMNQHYDITNGVPIIGNPNLPPQQTVAYEVGLKHRLNDVVGVEVSAYFKDVQNLLSTRQVTTIYDNQPVSYTKQTMDDYAKIKGIDVRVRFQGLKGLHGEVSYSYLDAKGTGSNNREFYYQYLGTGAQLPAKEYPLEFDITHSIKANLNYLIRPDMFSNPWAVLLLGNTNFNTQFNFSTGRPYTPQDKNGKPLEVGSRRLPSQLNMDLRVEKIVPFSKRIQLGIFVDVRNLLNIRNVVDVYRRTGDPELPIPTKPEYVEGDSRFAAWRTIYDPYTGDLAYESDRDYYEAWLQDWENYYNDPYNYSRPRIIRIGTTLYF